MWTGLTAEMRRQFIEFRRYPTELISQLIVIIAIFYGLFLGASYMAGGHMLTGHLDNVVIGYMLWTLSIATVGSMGYEIMNESQNGTMEQVMLSPLAPIRILLIRNVVGFIYNAGFSLVILFIVMKLTGSHLSFSAGDILPFLLAVISAIGLGFYVASITILFKRSSQFLNLLQFILLFLVYTPFTSLPGDWRLLSVIIPIAPMNGLLRGMMIHHSSLSSSPELVWWSIINAALWLISGIILMSRMSRRAMSKALLSHY